MKTLATKKSLIKEGGKDEKNEGNIRLVSIP